MVGVGRVVVEEVGVTWEWAPSTWEVVGLDLAGWVLLFVAISYFKDRLAGVVLTPGRTWDY